MEAKEKDPILESLLKENPSTEVPQEVEIHLRRHLTILRERMEAPKGAERFVRVFGWGSALRYATPAVAFILIGFIGYLIMSGGAQRAYAEVVEQLRNARSLTYTMTQQIEGSPIPDIAREREYVFKEPHYIRVSNLNRGYSVRNMAEKKGLWVWMSQKKYVEQNFTDAPYEEAQVSQVINEMRSLPERADEVLDEREMDGHNVRGFRVTHKGLEKTLWVDVKTGDLVRMEGEFVNDPGSHFVIENIRFNIEYDDAFFSLEPPSGFTPLQVDISSLPSEQDLINTLDFYTSHHVDGLFPEALNLTEFETFIMKSGKFREPELEGMTREEQLKIVLEIYDMCRRGLSFILPLKPQEWHYAGKGVKRGAPDTPVFWYKPDGSETFRVVYADLEVRDVAPEDLPPVPSE
jgi:outer membrane lipoprotein-sorting protein